MSEPLDGLLWLLPAELDERRRQLAVEHLRVRARVRVRVVEARVEAVEDQLGHQIELVEDALRGLT